MAKQFRFNFPGSLERGLDVPPAYPSMKTSSINGCLFYILGGVEWAISYDFAASAPGIECTRPYYTS